MKVLAVTGSSGGHIFPALSFLETLKDRDKDADILLILPKGSLIKEAISADFKVRYCSISTIKLNLGFRNLVAILKFFKGSLESLISLLGFRPDVVVGFGSLTSIPVILLARIFRIKTFIHEQNLIPGRANRLLAKFCDKIAISFEESQDYFRSSLRNIVFTGNPMRKGLKRIDKNEALEFFGFVPAKLTILVMGGSAGSHKINVEFFKAVSAFSDIRKLQIIHLSGIKDYDLLKDSYKDFNINIKLFSFLGQMQYAYSASDFVICRAGATTITEIIFFSLPAIIIPYPYAYGHQASNAKFLKDKGCAVIIKDSELDSSILSQAMGDFINNPDKIRMMNVNYNNIVRPEANVLLVNEIFK